jgi:hypothetical protein
VLAVRDEAREVVAVGRQRVGRERRLGADLEQEGAHGTLQAVSC